MTAANTLATLGNGPAFSAYLANTQSLSTGFQKVNFDTKEFDTNNNFASSRFTPTVAGYYQITASIQLSSSSTGEVSIAIFKNGTNFKQGMDIVGNPTYGLGITTLMYFNGSTDYAEVYLYNASAGKGALAGQSYTWFQGALVRGA
jgi:hypothetical protein